MRLCNKCNRELVPFKTDPDIIKYFCPDCDDIPGGAVLSGWPAFIDLITPKKH